MLLPFGFSRRAMQPDTNMRGLLPVVCMADDLCTTRIANRPIPRICSSESLPPCMTALSMGGRACSLLAET